MIFDAPNVWAHYNSSEHMQVSRSNGSWDMYTYMYSLAVECANEECLTNSHSRWPTNNLIYEIKCKRNREYKKKASGSILPSLQKSADSQNVAETTWNAHGISGMQELHLFSHTISISMPKTFFFFLLSILSHSNYNDVGFALVFTYQTVVFFFLSCAHLVWLGSNRLSTIECVGKNHQMV